MVSHLKVLSDLTEIRSQLRDHGSAHQHLLRLNLSRPLADIGFDWIVVLASVGAVWWLSEWLALPAICVIANRQRALGNILHDAGHRNLCRNRTINDAVASMLVAPLVFASLASYREVHFKHHSSLGDDVNDPDILRIPLPPPKCWHGSYLRHVGSGSAWLRSFVGDLAARDVPVSRKLYIVAWWGVVLVVLDGLVSHAFAVAFVCLWLVARATLFHLITTMREMCDHFGLQPGGIFTFTRDLIGHGFWRQLIHPRNNGYHLTHHLLPAVPYYRLTEAHRLFRQMPAYQTRGRVCDSYFSGAGAVTRGWHTGQRA